MTKAEFIKKHNLTGYEIILSNEEIEEVFNGDFLSFKNWTEYAENHLMDIGSEEWLMDFIDYEKLNNSLSREAKDSYTACIELEDIKDNENLEDYV